MIHNKPIKMLAVTPQDDSRSKNVTLLPNDEFAWRTQREGEISKNKTLLPIDELHSTIDLRCCLGVKLQLFAMLKWNRLPSHEFQKRNQPES